MMIETRKARQRQIAQLKEELDHLSGMVIAKEAQCIRVFNKPVQFNGSSIRDFKYMHNQEKELLAYYKTESGDINECFDEKLRQFHQEQKRRQRILKSFEAKFDVIGHAKGKEVMKYRESLKDKFNLFRAEFETLKNFFMEFKVEVLSKLHQAHTVAIEIIKCKEEEALRVLSEEKKRLSRGEARKEKLLAARARRIASLSFQSADTWTYLPSDDKVQESVSQVVSLMKQWQSRVLEFECNKVLDAGIENIESRLNALIAKLQRIEDMESQRHNMFISKRWSVMSYNLLKFSRCSSAINEAIEEASARESELQAQLEKEMKTANQIVPGTDVTVAQLRQEIIRLSRELSEETAKSEKRLKSIEAEHQKLREEADRANN